MVVEFKDRSVLDDPLMQSLNRTIKAREKVSRAMPPLERAIESLMRRVPEGDPLRQIAENINNSLTNVTSAMDDWVKA